MLTMAYRKNGDKLDELCILSYAHAPEGMGDKAEE